MTYLDFVKIFLSQKTYTLQFFFNNKSLKNSANLMLNKRVL